MKKNLLFLVFAFAFLFVSGQTVRSVHDVQFVSVADLASCNGASQYDGDTVTVTGVAVHDGNLTEIVSSSVSGGYRPGIHIVDTANNTSGGAFMGIQIHGVINSGPITDLNSIVAGDIVQITGIVGNYSGETQIYPLSNSDVTIINAGVVPAPTLVDVGDLNDGNQENQLETGEQYEGSVVLLKNVMVISVDLTSSRIRFVVADANGNSIKVDDRFFVQKPSSHTAVNPDNPGAIGSFVAPVVGMQFDTLIGIITQWENGCTGGTGQGYQISPFDASHYVVGATPPSITNVLRTPLVPTSSESPVIDCTVQDLDGGTVTSAYLHYTNDIAAGSFDSVALTLIGGSQVEYTANIPAMADGDMVGYFIKSMDNDGNISQYPATAGGAASNNVSVYTVRDNGLQIVDIQKVLDYNNDASYYVGQTVTVTGVVSASAQGYDLGYVFIQQPGQSEWSGINVTGLSDLVLLKRTEEITVTGLVEESFGFTRLVVSAMVRTGNFIPVEVTYFDPSDDNLYSTGEIEKYESMCVGIENGSTGMVMTNSQVTYNTNTTGEYTFGTSAAATQSTLVMAGRISNGHLSSMWVSLVADTFYYANQGLMEVDSVITTMDMEADTVIGIMHFAYSDFKILPRNNDDIINLSENGTAIVLDSTDYQYPTSIVEVNGKSIETNVYPNPASDLVSVSVNGINNFIVTVYDISGRQVSETRVSNNFTQISVNTLNNGVYFMKVSDTSGNQLAIEKIVIKH